MQLSTYALAYLLLKGSIPQLRLYLTQDRRWKEKFWLNMFDAVALALHHQALTKPPSRGR